MKLTSHIKVLKEAIKERGYVIGGWRKHPDNQIVRGAFDEAMCGVVLKRGNNVHHLTKRVTLKQGMEAQHLLFTMAHEFGHILTRTPDGGCVALNAVRPVTPRRVDTANVQHLIRLYDEIEAWLRGETYIPVGLHEAYRKHALRCLATYCFDDVPWSAYIEIEPIQRLLKRYPNGRHFRQNPNHVPKERALSDWSEIKFK